MKTQSSKYFAAALLLAMGVSASAQSSNSIRVNVPFEFVVGSQKLPADQYSVEESPTTGMVTLYGIKSKQSVSVLTGPAEIRFSQGNARLTFEQTGGATHLVRVLSSEGDARSFPVHSVK